MGCIISNQYEIIWFEGIQLPDTLVPDREDDQLEDDDEYGELSSENDDDDAGDDY